MNVFPWADYDIEVQAAVSDANEVLNCLQDSLPDILLVDYNIPPNGGCRLIQQILQNYPSVTCIMVSDQSDYHYVREAFLCGADDYLLKPSFVPEKTRELSQTLRNSFEQHRRIPQLMPFSTNHAVSPASVQNILPIIQKAVFEGLKISSLPDAPSVFTSGKSYLFCTIMLHSLEEFRPFRQNFNVDLVSRQLLEFMDSQIEYEHIFYMEKATCYQLLIFYDDSTEKMLLNLQRDFQMLKTYIETYLHLYVVMGTSHLYNTDFDNIATAYHEAVNMADGWFYRPKSMLYLHNPNDIRTLYRHLFASITQLLKMQDWNGIYDSYCQFALTVRDNNYPSLDFKNATIDLLFFISNESMRLALPGVKEFPYVEEIISNNAKHIITAHKIGTVMECFKEALHQSKILVFDLKLEEKGYPKPVEQALNYIHEYFSSPEISLNSIAEAINFNPTYISNIFHKKTGYTLNMYLMQLRLQKAKILLSSTEMPISEISYSCGFDSPKYFTSLFKKSESCTPGAYRKDHRPGGESDKYLTEQE